LFLFFPHSFPLCWVPSYIPPRSAFFQPPPLPRSSGCFNSPRVPVPVGPYLFHPPGKGPHSPPFQCPLLQGMLLVSRLPLKPALSPSNFSAGSSFNAAFYYQPPQHVVVGWGVGGGGWGGGGGAPTPPPHFLLVALELPRDLCVYFPTEFSSRGRVGPSFSPVSRHSPPRWGQPDFSLLFPLFSPPAAVQPPLLKQNPVVWPSPFLFSRTPFPKPLGDTLSPFFFVPPLRFHPSVFPFATVLFFRAIRRSAPPLSPPPRSVFPVVVCFPGPCVEYFF